MRSVVAVLNPRRIRQCVAAISELDTDRLWIRNLTEAQIANNWPDILDAASGYDRLTIVGDDSVPRQHALDAVLRAADEHRATTGWSNLSATDMRANLVRSPLAPTIGEDAYDLLTVQDVMEHPEPVFRTWLTGLTLCTMSLEDWERFPFDCLGRDGNGFGSDYLLSRTLDGAGVPIMAVREAFVWHVKERWNYLDEAPDKRLLTGIEPPELLLETGGRTIQCRLSAV